MCDHIKFTRASGRVREVLHRRPTSPRRRSACPRPLPGATAAEGMRIDAGNHARETRRMADGYGLPGAGHLRVRALFISDLHLGTRDCQAERLLDLLRTCEADLIYLVGDVVDGWRLKARWYWPRSHDDIVRCLLRKQHDGARILYIPGNHDEFLRHSIGLHLGGIEVV